MGNTVYFVWRSGVYIQGVFGIYDDLHKAIDKAEELIAEECDDYHDYHVSECALNGNVNMANEYGDRPLPKVTLTRKGTKVTTVKNY